MSKLLTDHDEIRSWASAHAGSPALIYVPNGHGGDDVVLKLRFGVRMFASDQDEARDQLGGIEPVTWQEWFEAFEEHQLALRVPDQVDGNPAGVYSFEKRA
ncbi:MAG: hypothetical protein KDJ19_11455 [Hyphomicrobiaceae bacterium]|nr:hypothetical protein [Hyphomicrobiaceae bacterium]MCC0024995.1 hypothetical protein [Hyphomicrobiaceae bacterium]